MGYPGKERTALKREASTTNGTKFGRPRKVDGTEHIATAKRMKADDHTGKDIAKYLGVSRTTLDASEDLSTQILNNPGPVAETAR